MANAVHALQTLLGRALDEQESRGYVHTAAEIASQPDVWCMTLEKVSEAFRGLSGFLANGDRLLLTGAGSSYYAALSAVPPLRKSYRCVEAIPSTEILMDPGSSFPRENFALVSLARSGNSPEGNAVFSLAEQLCPGRVKHIVITCSRDGELARLADGVGSRGLTLLLPEESNDKGLAMTASFSSLTIAAYALGFLDAQAEYGAVVRGLARAAATVLTHGSDLARALAEEGFRRVFFLGSRPFLGGALEAHLKVQEMSGGGVVAKAEDTLGFRHGFMAAVDGTSLVVLCLSRDPRRRLYEMDLLEEIRRKRLGKKVVVIAEAETARSEKIERFAEGVFAYGPAPSVTDEALSPLVALCGQLLGLFLSLKAGLRPDDPSPSGVITRVVRGVRIHPFGARA